MEACGIIFTDIEYVRKTARDMDGWLRDVRRDFHMYPELGSNEFRTSDKIKAYLDELGVEYEAFPGKTCVIGLVRGAYPGKTVAIRADMDALPISEKNTCQFKSRYDGVMHACGHDAHMAILLGAARFFAAVRNELAGNIKLFFQPAEETDGGAEDMIKLGCMKNPNVDYTIGLHVMPYLPCGTIETRYGTLNAASDLVDITIKGTKAHGAYPEQGADTIVAGAQIINALQTIVSRNISPLDSVVLSIGTINGGTARNVIADEVSMKAILRTADKNLRSIAKSRINAIVSGMAESMGVKGDVNFTEGYEALINNNGVVDIILDTAEKILGENKVFIKEKPSLGVEDFSFFLNECKGAFYHLGCGNAEKGISSPLHTDCFDIDEDCLHIGVMLHVAIAQKLLGIT